MLLVKILFITNLTVPLPKLWMQKILWRSDVLTAKILLTDLVSLAMVVIVG